MKTIYKAIVFTLLVSFTVVLYSCSSGSIMDNPELYKDQVKNWEERLKKNPDDIYALKNLSIFYIQTHQIEKGQEYVNRAYKLSPDDPELILYKGLSLEKMHKESEALQYYKRYPEVASSSPFREVIEGRYFWIKRQQAYADIDTLIKSENDISTAGLSDSTMAVFPLIYEGTNKEYFPLSRGFAEMVSIDLAKVKQLTILERIRIQAVLDELKFGQSSMVDPATAPRMGKLLGAGTIVSGDYNITDNGDFKIDLGSWDVRTRERKSWVNKTGDLKDFFTLQKEIVFAFLQKNGIELTQSEKEAIAYIPTQNLQSFLAYSKGLIQEDEGNFSGAESYFKQAVRIDPNFKAAGQQAQTSAAVGKSGGSDVKVITSLKEDFPAIHGPESNIVEDRIQALGSNVLSGFVNSDYTRTPAQDQRTPIESSKPLPLPPNPPPTK